VDEFVTLSNSYDQSQNGYYVFEVDNTGNIHENEGTTSKGWGTGSDWAGVTAGNFINDDFDEFITIRNYKKEIRLHKFNEGTNKMEVINSISLNTYFPENAKIVGVTSGNFDGIDPEYEIVILINSTESDTNGYYVYNVNETGPLLTEIAKSVTWGLDSDWKGITAGDFDADGIDEFIVHRNFDGDYKIRKLISESDSSSIGTVGFEYFPIDQNMNNVLGAGNIDINSDNDELIVLRNYDGGMVTYTSTYPILLNSNSTSEKRLTHRELNGNNSYKINISISPNPVNELLTVNSDQINLKFEIYNSSGILMKKGIIKENSDQINLSNFNGGIYFVKFRSKDSTRTKKIVVR